MIPGSFISTRCLAAICGVGMLLAACGGSQPGTAPASGKAGAGASTGSAPQTLDELYQAAKKEGTVSVFLSWQDDQFGPLEKAFTARYPGIKIDRLEVSPDKGLERIITEKAAGKVSADVAGARLSEMDQVLKRDLAASYDYATVFPGVSKEAVQDGNRYVIGYQNASLLSYNTKLLDARSAPKTWEDVLDPKWQGGKIIIPQDTSSVFWALAKEWGMDKATEYARKLKDQKPRFARSASETTRLLIAGDAPLALDVYAASILKYKDDGAPIEGTSASPVSINNNGVFALKDAKHPNAAKLFSGWIATPEAQKVFASATHRSLAVPGTDTDMANYVRSFGGKLVFEEPEDLAENSKNQADLLNIVTGKSAGSKTTADSKGASKKSK